jgi:hypothetical protein
VLIAWDYILEGADVRDEGSGEFDGKERVHGEWGMGVRMDQRLRERGDVSNGYLYRFVQTEEVFHGDMEG